LKTSEQMHPAGVDAALIEAVDALNEFGGLMLRTGTEAFRVRQRMGELAHALGIDALAVHVLLGSIEVTARRGSAQVTLVSEVAPLGIDARRLGDLERLARGARPGLSSAELRDKLKAITATPPVFPIAVTAIAVGIASGSFSYLNEGGVYEIGAAFAGGAVGQFLRSLLFRRHLNQFAVTAICAVLASGVYCSIMGALAGAGFAVPRHAAGFISSSLFLVPGFPLIAGMLDMLQHQTVAAIARLAYGTTVLLSAAFGLSIVAAAAGLTASPPVAPQLSEAATLGLRAIASFAGGCGFAVLYNSTPRTVLAVGCLALVGNELRLALHDLGMALPPATFLGALTVGLLASFVSTWLDEPRIALTVPGIIIMVPGTYAFETVVLFNQGDVLPALQAATLGAFVVGAMALGLAAARFFSERNWLTES
jgi:uncharacterized membrane protein YjjP (DUF1212 family)